jgi:hypothetical protein
MIKNIFKIIFFLLAVNVYGRMFESSSECDKHYGKPIKIEENQRLYKSMGFMILVHTYEDKVNGISYKKISNKRLSMSEIKFILKINAPPGTAFIKLPNRYFERYPNETALHNKNIQYVLGDAKTLKYRISDLGVYAIINEKTILIAHSFHYLLEYNK